MRKQPSTGKSRLQQPAEEPGRPHAMHKKKTTVGDVDLQIMEVIRDIRDQTREKDTAVEERRSFTGLKEEAFCRMVGETLERLSPARRGDAKVRVTQVLYEEEFSAPQ